MKACIFCPNPRTSYRGEHVWDDWLNREYGKPVRIPATVTEFGRNETLLREYKSNKFEVAKDVVCDACNHGWMSDLTTHAKLTLEGFIRYERAATLIELGIVTTVAFAFMKAAVLDYSAERERPPLIAPSICAAFRHSALSSDSIVIPAGVQVWLAHYRSNRRMESQVWIDSIAFNRGVFSGYNCLQITYVVGAFAFQLMFPKWTKRRSAKPPLPFFTQAPIWDRASVPIWPNVTRARWPPPVHVSGHDQLEEFRRRFSKVRFLA